MENIPNDINLSITKPQCEMNKIVGMQNFRSYENSLQIFPCYMSFMFEYNSTRNTKT